MSVVLKSGHRDFLSFETYHKLGNRPRKMQQDNNLGFLDMIQSDECTNVDDSAALDLRNDYGTDSGRQQRLLNSLTLEKKGAGLNVVQDINHCECRCSHLL